jgi:hypothetical protein
MANNFADLKKNRKSSFDKLSQDLDKLTKGNERTKDETFWAPTVDKAGNGFAIIRFLPQVAGEEVPYVRYWDHGFQGPGGKWYIENSLTSIGQEDPVAQFNGKLWNVSQDDNSPERKQARKQKRRLHFVSNILVVQDTANPENEGKVFKYKFGKKIFNKLNEKMNPEFPDEEPMNPYDFWDGANFKLKIRQVEGYRNYDKSEFDNPSAVYNDDDQIEAVWKQCHPLAPILAPENYKSYDELKKKLDQVLGLGDERTPAHSRGEQAQRQANRTAMDDDDDLPFAAGPSSSFKSAAPTPFGGGDDDADDSMSFFQKLAED